MGKANHILLWMFIGLAVLTAACSGPKNVSESEKTSVEVTGEDSVEYDVETFNTNFDVWYQRQNTPASYRSQSYYESWNKQYVSAWNARCASPSPSWNFEPVVGYDPNEDYGFEMNHKLFYYFMFVEHVLKKKIIPGGPKPVFH
ncbi:DUF6146 family protein [uncultured Draconibacterium sp.]|uniref:DUF6146 family protein n=1 Tax=uncultured Draconibacterium sp. TaxID=1573823 RepID=UPI002AA84E13|nr:DUF6146 family protein [uncultured Draconibacterium sp.]